MVKLKKPLLDKVKQGSKVFVFYNKDKLSISRLKQYYCTPALYSLHKMLHETDRVTDEYKKFQCVYSDKEISKPVIVRLDHWVYVNNNRNLYDCYLLLSKQLVELIMLAELNNHQDHIERRCFKIFHTYITIVELLQALK